MGRISKAAINRAIDALMQRQSGLIGYRQLRQIGLSPKSIASRAGSGDLVLRAEPRRGGPAGYRRPNAANAPQRRSRISSNAVFSRDSSRLDLDGLRWRALLAAPPSARLAEVSSCALLDLCGPTGTTVHIVHAETAWRPPRGVIAHQTASLPARDRDARRGMPCTAASRSIFDAARRVDADFIDDLLDRAVERRVYNELGLKRLIDEFDTTSAAAKLDAAIGRLDDKSGEFRSRFERKVTRLVQTSTLIPEPVVNVLVHGYRPDLRFIGTRAIVECDGRDYHRSLAQILADERREEILYQLGFVILRLRWRHVQYERDETLRRIEQFVLANLAPPVPRG